MAVAMTLQLNFALCPSYVKVLLGLITNRGAACRRSKMRNRIKNFYSPKNLCTHQNKFRVSYIFLRVAS